MEPIGQGRGVSRQGGGGAGVRTIPVKDMEPIETVMGGVLNHIYTVLFLSQIETTGWPLRNTEPLG